MEWKRGIEKTLFVKDLLSHWKLCSQLNFLRFLNLYTFQAGLSLFFFCLFVSFLFFLIFIQIDLTLIFQHCHALLSMLIRVCRLVFWEARLSCTQPTNIPAATFLKPISANTFALQWLWPFSPQPIIVNVGCNGLLTGLGWGNFVAGLYSEVPNLPLRKKRAAEALKLAIGRLILKSLERMRQQILSTLGP